MAYGGAGGTGIVAHPPLVVVTAFDPLAHLVLGPAHQIAMRGALLGLVLASTTEEAALFTLATLVTTSAIVAEAEIVVPMVAMLPVAVAAIPCHLLLHQQSVPYPKRTMGRSAARVGAWRGLIVPAFRL